MSVCDENEIRIPRVPGTTKVSRASLNKLFKIQLTFDGRIRRRAWPRESALIKARESFNVQTHRRLTNGESDGDGGDGSRLTETRGSAASAMFA